MPDLLAGSTVKGLDTPPSADAFDNTVISYNSTTPAAGSPELGVTFTAPTTGCVRITVGGGLRNAAANDNRIFLSPQVFLGTSSGGTEVVAPTVSQRGIGSTGGFANNGYQYLSRTSRLTGLTPGATYYVRTMHATANTAGNCDIAARSILVEPTT
jgi:hypothetical protein